MRFQALMVSLDNASADVLATLFDDLVVDHERCSAPEASAKLDDIRIDLLALSFDDTAGAENLIQTLRRSSMSRTAVTLALVSDPAKITQAFGAGANFALHLPLSEENVRPALRAAVALLQRERRRQFRVPVQLPVSLSCNADPDLEGILLDLSEGGMDVLAAKPLGPGEPISVKFCLPPATDMVTHAQVVWANANGQTGLQFIDLDEAQSRALSSWLGTNAPQLPPQDPEPLSDYKLSDLSLGGCYIETLAPFPRNTRIDLCMRVGDFEVHLDGSIRVVYPAHGMGVQFAPGAKQQDLLLSLFDRLAAQPGATPDVLVWPKGLNFKDAGGSQPPFEGDDPLVQLLYASTAMSQDEFLTELRRQRNSQAEVTTV
jgi:c-di-GMP-binding flagellar brake protein YcgR